ncbi:nucleoside phosphatase GDA1/CD39 [Gongronella butleri]|nr:nucleoside phosphatase GDA1/CD39 [Gongronella butleri]
MKHRRKAPSTPYAMLKKSAKNANVNPWGRIVFAAVALLFALLVVVVPEPTWQTMVETVRSTATSLTQSSPKGEATKHVYALMVDAGSTGSRIHVYQFKPADSASQSLESLQFDDEVLFQQTIPGLSAYDPQGAAQSLDPLLEAALAAVPAAQHRWTPIAVKATAGLRLLGHEQSEAILDAVYDRLHTRYPFMIVGGRQHGVSIMDGKDEAVYAWITVNSLLSRLGTNETAAIFDLGGGSTQIVFEPKHWFHHPSTLPTKTPDSDDVLTAADHQFTLNHDGHTHTLYQHSYLGYGLMEVRKLVHQTILENAADPQRHPCLPHGLAWTHKDDSDVQFVGAGHLADCKAVIDSVLNKDAVCHISPCAFDGVHQPKLASSFPNGPIYIFSYFFDRTQPLGLPAKFKLPQLEALMASVCSGQLLNRVNDPDLRFELLDRPEWCLDLTYIYRLLSYGYEIPNDRWIHVAKKIHGVETGWCLGAAIALLDDMEI